MLAALAAFVGCAQVLAEGRQAQADWGTRQRIVRIERLVAKGSVVVAADVSLIDLPIIVVPPGVVADLGDVIGKRAREPLRVGDVVLAARLQRTDAIRPQNQRGVAIPRDKRVPDVVVGQAIEVIDPGQPSMTALSATVLEVSDDQLVVGASPIDAARIAQFVRRDSVAVLAQPAES